MKNQIRFLRFPGIPVLPIFAIFFAGAIALGQTLEEQFQAADAELNRVYKELRAKLNDEQKAELKKSQLAWIKEKEKLAEQSTGQLEDIFILTKGRITYLKQRLKESRETASCEQKNILNINYIRSTPGLTAKKINEYLDHIAHGSTKSDFVEFFYNISSSELASSKKEFKVYDASESESFFADLATPWPLEGTSAMKSDHAVAPIQVVPQTRRPAGKLASEVRGKDVIARSFINDPHVYVFDARSEVEIFRFLPTVIHWRDKNMTPIHLCLSADERLLSCSTGLGLCGLNGSGGGLNAVYVANLESRELISRGHSLSLFFESSDGAVKLGDSNPLKDNDPLQLWRDGKMDGKPAPWMNLIRFNERELSAKLFSAETKECIVNRFSREDLLDKDGQIYGNHGDAFVAQPKPGTTNEWTVVWPEVFGSSKAFTIRPTTGWVKQAKDSFQPTTVESSSYLAGHVFDGRYNFWAHILGCSTPPSGLIANKIGFGPSYRSPNGDFTLFSIDEQGWGVGRTFAVLSGAAKTAVALPDLTGLYCDYSGYGRTSSKPTSLPAPLPHILKRNSANRHHFYDSNSKELYISVDSVGLLRFSSDRKKEAEIFAAIPAFDFFAVSHNMVLGVPDRAVAKMQLWGLNGVHLVDIFPSLFGSMLVSVPEGFYLSSGRSGTAFTIGMRGYPFEQFDLRLNRPDVVLERLGAPDEAISIAKQLREKRLKRMGVTEEMLQPDFHLPEIEIVGDLPSSTAGSELALKIKATDSKYPLDRLRVYLNNVPINGKEGELLRAAKSQTLERTIPIKLAAGRNKIQVSVLNSAGAESLYANAEVTCTAQRPKPTLYAVAMGVSEYANPDWNLKYAAKDARDILERVKARSSSSYGEIKELLLTDREATKQSLGKIRDFLSTATVDDTVLMFVAGHGLLDSKYDYYFGTSDIDFNNPSENGIAFEEFDDLLAELPCLRKSLLLDTCHAGELDEEEKKMLASAQANPNKVVAMLPAGARGMNIKPIEGARGKSEWYDRLQGLFVDLRRGSGSTILSSSAGAEYALESSEQKNGIFTYAVLEALDGKEGADANKDGSVTMSELADYVRTRVAALTNNKQSPNVRRVNLEGDFALAKQ